MELVLPATLVWKFSPYSPILPITAVVAVILAVVVGRRRPSPGAVPFALLLLATAEWAALVACEHAAVLPVTKILCAKLEYLGILSVSPLWLTFALGYTESKFRLVGSRLVGLWIIPLVGLVLAWTNEWHGWIWTSIVPSSPVAGAPLLYRHGPWFWCAAAYNYGLNAVGTVVLARAAAHVPRPYRSQSIALLVGMMLPSISDAIYLSGASPLGIDTTPLAFTLTGFVYVIGVFRLRLLELVPIARSRLVEGMADGVLVLDAQDRVIDVNPRAQELLGLKDTAMIGANGETFLAAWPALVAYARGTSDIRAEVEVDGGATRQCLDVQISSLLDPNGGFRGRLIVFRDVTVRKRAEDAARIQARTEERLRQTETLLTMSQAVASTLERTEVFRRSTRALVQALDADMGGAWLMNAARDQMIPVAGYRVPKEVRDRLAPVPALSDDPLIAEILELKGPIYAADSQRDHRFNHPWARLVAHKSGLVVPLRLRDETIGGLSLIWTREQHVFVPEEEQLIEALAAQVVAGVDTARLAEARAVFAQEEERRRLAYELHDGIGQVLVSAKQHLETCGALWTDDPSTARKQFETGLERLVRAITETRAALRALASPAIAEVGLVEAVRRTVYELAREAGWQVLLEEDIQHERLPPTVETATFQIVREAVANAARHAHPSAVHVTMHRRGDWLELLVRDDGCGFVREAIVTPGLGIPGMRERARLLGGDVTIDSGLGAGTRVHAYLPLTATATR